MCSPMSMATPL
ncbi:unnamed protein product [Spodoptera littoralis]|uniref:Uncharacterized protein n=1 Tax=Spodoptera littoralis TaxID=7109 RepID=A0A9P0HWS9_SPOLI|nr:unnamed protein product [Spodoptera littoralis]CAH1636826.1 unnamed protein product [Spodoptera littoralis]